MSTATCPCCGNKEPVPDSPRRRRLLCSNCGTPFLSAAASPPGPPAAPPQVEVVAVNPVPPSSRSKKKPSTPQPPPRHPKKSDKRPREKGPAPAPASTWETLSDETPTAGDGKAEVFVPPEAGRRPKKRSAGRTIALVLGCGAFLAVVVCGGVGTAGYIFLRPYWGDALAAATDKDGSTEQAAAPETEFVDAKTKSASQGDVSISVTTAVVEFVKWSDGKGEFQSKEKLLVLKLRIDNASASHKIAYTGWSQGEPDPPPGTELATLTDEHGDSYKLITFGGERRVQGQVRAESIAPGKGVSDVLVFDPPAPAAQSLKLALPARNFGGTGTIGFMVPRSMIRVGGPPQETSVPELIRALREGEGPARLEAAHTLAARGPAAAMAAKQLGETLHEKDPALRLAAAQALGKIGVTAHVALPALMHALGDSDPAVRSAAHDALGKIGDPLRDDLADLAQAVKDQNPAVRLFALQTLTRMDLDPKTVTPIFAGVVKDADRGLRLAGVQALGKAGPKAREAALPALLIALRDPDAGVRKAAGEAMAGLGPPAATDVPALRTALREKGAPPELRAQAANSLGKLGAGAREAVPELAEALASPDVAVRRAAAAALVQIGPPAKGALLRLIDALGDKEKDKEVRRLALEAIARLGADGKLASVDVANLIDDIDPATRKAAGAALAAIDPDAALPAYARALFVKDDGVRLDAAEFLVSLGPKARPRTADLIAALSDKNPAVRLKVARALTLADPTSGSPVPVLTEFLASKDVAVRREASAGLAAVGATREAIPALASALKDDDSTVRINAVTALGPLGQAARPALKNLITALQDRKSHETIAGLLVKIGADAAVPPLIKALKDKDPAVRLGAALALQKLAAGAQEALPALDSAYRVEKEDDVKKAVRAAAKEIREKS